MTLTSTRPTPNVPLLRTVVGWAEAEAAKPDGLWRQRDYAAETPCGTAFCIAGKAVVEAHGDDAELIAEGGDGLLSLYLDGGLRYWHTVAQRALGLTSAEADVLFDQHNTIETVRAVAERIAARAGEVL